MGRPLRNEVVPAREIALQAPGRDVGSASRGISPCGKVDPWNSLHAEHAGTHTCDGVLYTRKPFVWLRTAPRSERAVLMPSTLETIPIALSACLLPSILPRNFIVNSILLLLSILQ